MSCKRDRGGDFSALEAVGGAEVVAGDDAQVVAVLALHHHALDEADEDLERGARGGGGAGAGRGAGRGRGAE